MPLDLTGTTVIVTGAAGGLGSVMSLALAVLGARVAAFDLPSADDRMDQLMAASRRQGNEARIQPFHCDVTSPSQCDSAVTAAIAQCGMVHGLVNCAGLGPQDLTSPDPGRLLKFFEVSPELWRSRMDTNANGAFFMARAVAPRLIAQGRGKIVNVTTSYQTMVRGLGSPYGPSKAALEAATLAWSRDLDGTGVTVNVLIPGGAADTRMVPVQVAPDRAALVQPQVMAAPIQWLMSRQSDGVTGRRFIGKDWDPALDPTAAAAKASAAAAW